MVLRIIIRLFGTGRISNAVPKILSVNNCSYFIQAMAELHPSHERIKLLFISLFGLKKLAMVQNGFRELLTPCFQMLIYICSTK
jgi:hypothetical protein